MLDGELEIIIVLARYEMILKYNFSSILLSVTIG